MDTSDAKATQELLNTLSQRLNPANAGHLDVAYQFRFDTAPACHVSVRKGHASTGTGDHPAPTLTMFFDTPDTALQFVTGSLDVMAAFMAGQLRADGHIVLAMTLPLIFSGAAGREFAPDLE